MNFFKLLSAIEQEIPLDQIRFSSDITLGFPVQAVKSVHRLTENDLEITATFSGLYGVSSVLPPFMNEWALENSASGETLRALLDIFQKRLYLMKYRLWKEGYAPYFMQSGHTAYAKLLRAVSGDRMPASDSLPAYAMAGWLGKVPASALGLRKICEIMTGFSVSVEENIVRWVLYTPPNKSRLGDNMLLGRKYLEDRHLFYIRINCITIKNMQKCYHNSVCLQQLRSAIRSYLDPALCYALWLEASDGLVQTVLGDCRHIGLGLGSVLGRIVDRKSVSVKLPST